MAGERLDNLARALAGASSRRQMLKVVIGAAFGGAIGRWGPGLAPARDAAAQVGCGSEGQPCCALQSCPGDLAGLACVNGTCVACGVEGAPCCTVGPACDLVSLYCSSSGVCSPCGIAYAPCCGVGSLSACGAGLVCQAGACLPCSYVGERCGQGHAVCCGNGNACSAGVCVCDKSGDFYFCPSLRGGVRPACCSDGEQQCCSGLGGCGSSAAGGCGTRHDCCDVTTGATCNGTQCVCPNGRPACSNPLSGYYSCCAGDCCPGAPTRFGECCPAGSLCRDRDCICPDGRRACGSEIPCCPAGTDCGFVHALSGGSEACCQPPARYDAEVENCVCPSGQSPYVFAPHVVGCCPPRSTEKGDAPAQFCECDVPGTSIVDCGGGGTRCCPAGASCPSHECICPGGTSDCRDNTGELTGCCTSMQFCQNHGQEGGSCLPCQQPCHDGKICCPQNATCVNNVCKCNESSGYTPCPDGKGNLTCCDGTQVCQGGTCQPCTDGNKCGTGLNAVCCMSGHCCETDAHGRQTCVAKCSNGGCCDSGKCVATCGGCKTCDPTTHICTTCDAVTPRMCCAANGTCVAPSACPAAPGQSGGCCSFGVCGCQAGQICQAGSPPTCVCDPTACAVGCCAGTTCIGQAVQTDTQCGTIGAACTDCTKLAATPNCCGGACTNKQTDLNNCGTCGNICTSGTTCTAGQCTSSTAEVCVQPCPTGSCWLADTQTCYSNYTNTCCGGELCDVGPMFCQDPTTGSACTPDSNNNCPNGKCTLKPGAVACACGGCGPGPGEPLGCCKDPNSNRYACCDLAGGQACCGAACVDSAKGQFCCTGAGLSAVCVGGTFCCHYPPGSTSFPPGAPYCATSCT